MSDIKNQYSKTQQLSEGVYVIEDGNGSWGGEVNHNFELLNSILSKKTLTITQGDEVLGTYNAKEESTIDIPKSENFNLTFKSGDSVIGSFDNTEDVEIEIPKGNVENKTLTITQGDEVLGTFDNSQDVEIELPEVSSGTKKVFTKKLPFVELHFTEPFLTDVLGYESVEQAVEWLPYRNSVKVASIPFLKAWNLGSEIDNVFYKDINTIYKGEHNSTYFAGDLSLFQNNVDREDYSKLEKEEKTGTIYYLVEKYRVLGDTSEKVDVQNGYSDLNYSSVSDALDNSYNSIIDYGDGLEDLINSSLGDTEYIIHAYAFRVSNDNFYISSNPDLDDFWHNSDDSTSVEERIEQFNNVLQNIEDVESYINFRIFDKSKIVPDYFNSIKTHVFRFISNKNNANNYNGSYSTIFLYPNDNGMYHVNGNTNLNSNAYLVGASFESQKFTSVNVYAKVGSVDVTDTINDDLEETFKEVYNL